MHIDIDSVAKIAKGFTQKIEKQDDDIELVIGHLKFADCIVSREAIDEFCGQAIGWSESCLYDEFGYPRFRGIIELPFLVAEFTGVVRGVAELDRIELVNAELSSITLTLGKMGATLSGEITWQVAGDESSGLEPLLGKLCAVRFVLSKPEQQDLVTQANEARNTMKKMVDDISAAAGKDGSVTITAGNSSVTIHGKDAEGESNDDAADDPLYGEAVSALVKTSATSVSSLQRILKIGYNRSARLLERMEKQGIIGPMRADGGREVLVNANTQAVGSAH